MNSNIDSERPTVFDRAESIDANAASEELQSILDDVDTFLLAWCDRVQSDVDALDKKGDAKADLDKRIEEFQHQVQVWNAKRDSEANRIEEQAAQLTEAWLRLESEQRTLLQMREQRLPAATCDRPTQHVTNNQVQKEQDFPTGDRPQTSSSQASSDCHSNRIAQRHTTEGPRSESAIQQFERLKQEVERGRSDSLPL